MHEIRRSQLLPLTLTEAWDFFSSPRNLRIITPPYMRFEITSADFHRTTYAGMIMRYRIRPLLNFPVTWVSEITHVHPPYFFVDEQKLGPFRFWHHQHVFRETDGGIEMTDMVSYCLPFGWVGRILEKTVIRRRLEAIFDYRRDALASRFG